MRSAQQRGTARANIAKFNQVANDTDQKLERQNIARNWELRNVSRHESAQGAISFFSNTDGPLLDRTDEIITKAPAEAAATHKSAGTVRKFSTNAEDANKAVKSETPRNWDLRVIGRRGSARDTINMFNNIANVNKEKLDKNPFSKTYSVPKYDTSAQDYGRPTRGSKTEARGIRAGNYVMREVLFLCEIINTHAEGEPPNRIIKFGPLFYIYAHYSDKLVGMLIRARKYKLVDFEGEMLYQSQDDDKIIRLLKPIEEIRKMSSSGDPANCIAFTDHAK